MSSTTIIVSLLKWFHIFIKLRFCPFVGNVDLWASTFFMSCLLILFVWIGCISWILRLKCLNMFSWTSPVMLFGILFEGHSMVWWLRVFVFQNGWGILMRNFSSFSLNSLIEPHFFSMISINWCSHRFLFIEVFLIFSDWYFFSTWYMRFSGNWSLGLIFLSKTIVLIAFMVGSGSFGCWTSSSLIRVSRVIWAGSHTSSFFISLFSLEESLWVIFCGLFFSSMNTWTWLSWLICYAQKDFLSLMYIFKWSYMALSRIYHWNFNFFWSFIRTCLLVFHLGIHWSWLSFSAQKWLSVRWKLLFISAMEPTNWTNAA